MERNATFWCIVGLVPREFPGLLKILCSFVNTELNYLKINNVFLDNRRCPKEGGLHAGGLSVRVIIPHLSLLLCKGDGLHWMFLAVRVT
jgi:hypothetical protein